MRKTAIIHIGLHKTGTSSLQQFLLDRRADLLMEGFAVYQSMMGRRNHVELGLASLRPDLETFDTLRFKIENRDEFRRWVEVSLAQFVRGTPAHTCLFSSEGLSFLRTAEEAERLKSLFPPEIEHFKIIMTQRDPDAWLASYRHHIETLKWQPSTSPASALYVADDTWLIDREPLIEAIYKVFGNLIIYDYRANGLNGQIISDIGIQTPFDENFYYINRQDGKKSRPFFQRFRRKLSRKLLRLV